MPQADSQSNIDPLDQTFNVDADGTPVSARLQITDDEPSISNELDATIRLRGRHVNATFTPEYPAMGAGARDDGRYVVRFNAQIPAFTSRHGDFIMGGATGIVIPRGVGDRICEHFDMDTLDDRANEVAEESFRSQLRARLEHGDDEFRDEVEALLERTK